MNVGWVYCCWILLRSVHSLKWKPLSTDALCTTANLSVNQDPVVRRHSQLDCPAWAERWLLQALIIILMIIYEFWTGGTWVLEEKPYQGAKTSLFKEKEKDSTGHLRTLHLHNLLAEKQLSPGQSSPFEHKQLNTLKEHHLLRNKLEYVNKEFCCTVHLYILFIH